MSASEASCRDGVAVIFAGGVGSRMEGADRPKQFLELGGEAIICHVLDRFEEADCIQAVVVVCVEGWIEYLQGLLSKGSYSKVASVVPGGTTGQGSIYNGLAELRGLGLAGQDTVVLVHDGVRPLITEETIRDCYESARDVGPTAVTAPVTETVVVCGDGVVESVVDRSRCRLARAPQGFRFGELWEAHQRARAEGRDDFVDSISLMSHYGHAIHVVDGPEENIKITTPRDFLTFKGFVDLKEYEQIWR